MATATRYIVNENTGCWEWQLYVAADGYGRWKADGRPQPAHVVMYTRLVGPVPPGRELDHLCRNRACVNPGHLEPVTHAENEQRGDSAKLTIDQVREIRRRYVAGGLSQRALAEEYAMTHQGIGRVLRRETWRNA